MRRPLKIGFKGERIYLHGSDFFDALEAMAREFTGKEGAFVSRLAFRHFARNICEISSTPPEELECLTGQGRYQLLDGTTQEFWLIETGKSVEQQRPFDEGALLADARMDFEQRSACLPQRSSNTPIEDVIALAKFLNYKVMPNIQGKWLFGQLDISVPLRDDYRKLDIKMKNFISGRFSVSEIIVDGFCIGSIRFIVGEP